MSYGDEVYTRTLEPVKRFWEAKPLCHISDPTGCEKTKDKKTYGYFSTIGSRFEYENFIQLQNIPSCMKEMVNQEYWNSIQKGMKKELMAAALAATGLVMMNLLM